MKRSALFIICILFFVGSIYSVEKPFVVVIDAGHGGKDHGAVRDNYREKAINLGVALALGSLIKKNMKDVKVVYTRDTDTFVELNDRAGKANKVKANLFISVHTNSTDAKKTSASGPDTYILGLARSEENLAVAKRENSVILLEDDYSTKYGGFDPNSPESYIIFEFMTNKYMEQSLDFAGLVQKEFKSRANRVDRGVRQAGFLVLRKTSMPAVLIELGFINNPTEAAFLTSKAGQEKMAESIYFGFRKYKAAFDKKCRSGSDVVTPVAEDLTANTDETQEKKDGEVIISPAQNTAPNISNNQEQTEYRIQFLYSPKKLPNNSKDFKGLSPVGYYYENGYKYTYGSTKDFDEIQKQLKLVKAKFKDAFVVRFKNGIRIVK